VIKPVDSSGQRGTAIFKDPLLINDLFDNAIKYSKTGKVLVDQFIDGPEVHVTMQVINGAVHFLALSDRITLDKTNFGIAVRHLGPSEIDDRTNEAIKSMCRQSIEAIGLKNGVVTCEVILQQEQPILMEIAIRVPGGYLRDVAMHLSGIDLIKSTIWYSTGDYKPLEALKTEMVYPAVSVKFITSLNIDGSIDKISTIDGLEEAQKIPGVQLINFHFDKEFSVPALNTSVGRFGVIVSTGHSRNDALNATEKAFNTLRINNSYLKEYPNYNPFNKDFK
jgi:formate-dependent phosphoribosylglycinamide formyltransferase (GAR transformylase)